jgi:hypothetical protein
MIGAMIESLCESCGSMREIVTPKGSRFLLCRLAETNRAFPKYPPQPVAQCEGYRREAGPAEPQLKREK